MAALATWPERDRSRVIRLVPHSSTRTSTGGESSKNSSRLVDLSDLARGEHRLVDAEIADSRAEAVQVREVQLVEVSDLDRAD